MKLVLPVAALVAGATIFIAGTNAVVAQSTGESLVDRISTRFDLSPEEVQQVFDEHKEAKQAERQERFTERLDSLVEDGTITGEQKTLIEEKFAELRATKEELRDSDASKEEMKEQLTQLKEDLQAWADENGINLEDVRPEHKGMKKGRHLNRFN